MSGHPQQHVILGILIKKKRHDYAIHLHFSSGLGRAWHAGINQVSALLKYLEPAVTVASGIEMQKTRRYS